jgi:SET domain-containing protein
MESIPARQRVIEYAGQRISAEEAARRQALRRTPGKPPPVYFFYLNRQRGIDAMVGGSGAELINHSCSPNLRARRIRGRLFFFSRRIIRKAEELTLDYCFRLDEPIVKCRCGSPRCRGTINRK